MDKNTSKKLTDGSVNLFHAILATIKGELVDDAVKEERVSLCNSCDKLILPLRRCGLCECFVDWKASIPNQECPAGKWKAQNGTQR